MCLSYMHVIDLFICMLSYQDMTIANIRSNWHLPTVFSVIQFLREEFHMNIKLKLAVFEFEIIQPDHVGEQAPGS